MTRVQTVVPLAESDGRNQTVHSDEQKSEWASQRQQSLRRDGRERIISRRVSSTVNPVCFDQCRLIRHQWPQSQLIELLWNFLQTGLSTCIGWDDFHEDLTRPNHVISLLIPDGYSCRTRWWHITDGCVSCTHGGSIRADTRCLHQRKLAKMCVFLFSKTDCATGACLWEKELLMGFLAKLSTSSDPKSTTNFSEQVKVFNTEKVTHFTFKQYVIFSVRVSVTFPFLNADSVEAKDYTRTADSGSQAYHITEQPSGTLSQTWRHTLSQ